MNFVSDYEDGNFPCWIKGQLEFLLYSIERTECFDELRSSWTIFKMRKEFDLLKYNIPSNEILLIVLLMSDGCVTHTIAVTKNWIFDSNFPFLLEYSKDSLDLCCGVNASFVNVYRGYRFHFLSSFDGKKYM
jgi:hypothetical protein